MRLQTGTDFEDTPLIDLMAEAAEMTLAGKGFVVTYSRKVFIPLTRLCRDVCHYCTFATTPGNLVQPFLSREEVLAIARAGESAGCREALFTLGDRPEARYASARMAGVGGIWLDPRISCRHGARWTRRRCCRTSTPA